DKFACLSDSRYRCRYRCLTPTTLKRYPTGGQAPDLLVKARMRMKGGYNLFRENIKFPLLFFVVSVIWQLIANKEVQWIENIGIAIIMFLIFLFYNWSQKPYSWKKNSDE